ncbi:MAG: N-acetylmuramoyl-L-alanine amidase [Gordonibacter sp.]|uniref:N-acetylmuramoyl-L-alanine amidase n=1 Tax=Gordonibacter sp. TaxID=1968902 RepID=UPI002FC9CEC6
MIITTNAGHTPTSPGAGALLNEVACNRPLRDQVNDELRRRGHEVYDCTAPDDMGYPDELDRQVCIANESGATLAVSMHLNAGGGTGPEVLYWDGDDHGRALAAKISANLARALGLPDRGAKAPDDDLAFLRDTGMTALIVEACFVDSPEDKEAWDRTSWADIAAAIADGIEGKDWAKPAAPAPSPEPTPEPAPEPEHGCNETTHVVKPGDTIIIGK